MDGDTSRSTRNSRARSDTGLYLGLTIDVTEPITVRTVFQAEDMRLRAGMGAGISLSIPIPKFGVWPVLEIEAAECVRSDLLPLNDPYPVGITTITWTALDGGSPPNSATAPQTVTVTDTMPPVLGPVAASEVAIWPPNHGMREITITYGAKDECGQVTGSLSVSSSEPVNGTDDGNTEPDWEIVDAHTVRLRAERSGIGAGRVYTINVTVVDGSANSSTGRSANEHEPGSGTTPGPVTA